MREAGLAVHRRRRYRTTTSSRHALPVAPNLLGRRFVAMVPNAVWAADITYVASGEGWLYLAVVIDLCTREIVGWAMASHLRAELVATALTIAVLRRRPPRGLIHHSDRGSQYASAIFRRLLAHQGIIASMSRKGDCYDNAPVESWFSTLKTELVDARRSRTRAEARAAIFEYIEVFYSRQRRHSALGYTTPAQFATMVRAA
jgi:transposase InsO family protein